MASAPAAAAPHAHAASVAMPAETPQGDTTQVTRNAAGRTSRLAIQLPIRR
jgi:hypothetical protein